jgi:drug/metabolite transporter (DMT)-like permease
MRIGHRNERIRMTTSYLLMAMGLLSFAAMGVIHKIGDRCGARPLPIALYALVTAGLLSAVRVLWTHSLSTSFLPPRILLVALPFGASAGLALWFFQTGLRHGSIATSWLLINLSAGVPTVLSIVFYREPVGWKKALVLVLIVVSLLLLWWDRRAVGESPDTETSVITTEVI